MSPEQNVSQLITRDLNGSPELDELFWGSLCNHNHDEQGRGAHDPNIREAYYNGTMTSEQCDQLRLRPVIDYFPLEMVQRDLGHLGLAAAM